MIKIKPKWAALLGVFLFQPIFLLGADTLRYYTPGDQTVAAYGAPKILMQRFYPKMSKVIHVKALMHGPKGSSVTMHLFGHEGGTQVPQRDPQGGFHAKYLKNLINPITVSKKVDGDEWVDIAVSGSPALRNNQAFIAFDHFTNGAKIHMSTQPNTNFCRASASQGGLMYPLLVGDSAAGTLTGQSIPLMVDIVVNTPVIIPQLVNYNATSGIPENITNRSIATADLDNDGDLDLLLRGRYFENEGKGKFKESTSALGLSGNPVASSMVDLNNDGHLDIVFLDAADSSFVFENSGSNSFTKKYLKDIPRLKSLHCYSFGDINGDGFVDLFLGQLWATYPTAEPNFLLLNDKNGGFTDVTTRLYPQHNGTHNFPNNPPQSGIDYRNRRSRGSQFVDFDNDGDADLYVTNYFLEPDEFYENDGSGNFTDISSTKKIDRNPGGGSNHGTGVDWADYDNDGDMDLLLPQFAHPGWNNTYGHRGSILFTNSGAPDYNFSESYDTHNWGIQWEETHAGAVWGDLDNNGFLDFYITTYYGCRYTDVYLNSGSFNNPIDLPTFFLSSSYYGVDTMRSGNDGLIVDLDGDGWNDILGGDQNRFRFFRQDVNVALHEQAIQVKVKNTTGNKFGIGSKVVVRTDRGNYTQQISCGRGQMMQKPYYLHFGLRPNEKISRIEVNHPDGLQEVFTDIPINHKMVLEEGGKVTEGDTLIHVGEPERPWGSISENPKSDDIFTWPNPTNGTLNISTNEEIESTVELELLDIFGRRVLSDEMDLSSSPGKLDLSSLPKGTYILNLSTEELHLQKRIIKN